MVEIASSKKNLVRSFLDRLKICNMETLGSLKIFLGGFIVIISLTLSEHLFSTHPLKIAFNQTF